MNETGHFIGYEKRTFLLAADIEGLAVRQEESARQHGYLLRFQGQGVNIVASGVAQEHWRVCWIQPHPKTRCPGEVQRFHIGYYLRCAPRGWDTKHIQVVQIVQPVDEAAIVRPGRKCDRPLVNHLPSLGRDIKDAQPGTVDALCLNGPAIRRPTRRKQSIRSRESGDHMTGEVKDAYNAAWTIPFSWCRARAEGDLAPVGRP